MVLDEIRGVEGEKKNWKWRDRSKRGMERPTGVSTTWGGTSAFNYATSKTRKK